MNCTQAISSAVALVGIAMFHSAQAHSWYSTTKDPMTGYRCCGGSDCGAIPESWVRYERDGFRLRLTIGQALAVNPKAKRPIDAFIPSERVQPSPDTSFHVCLYAADRRGPSEGVICFFAPMVSQL